MFQFIAGIAVGAAFSPFWISVWNWGSAFVKAKLSAEQNTKDPH